MTEQHIFERETHQKLKNLQHALDQTVILLITNEEGIITYANKQFCDVSQYTLDELKGEHFRKVCIDFHHKAFFQHILKQLVEGKRWEGELCNRAKDGSIYWVKTVILPFLNEYGQVDEYISVFTDITLQKKSNELPQHIASHDELTGLPSRRSLHQRIMNEIERGEPFAVFDIDINRFKSINDGLGHAIGDQFLIEVSERLTSIELSTNSFYRQGADEFALVLLEVKELDAMALKIMEQFKKPFIIEGHKFYSSISIGIALYPQHGEDSELLLNNADLAMLRAKERRGNNYFVYSGESEPQKLKDITLETKLYDALRLEQLQLYYQPKIDVQTGKMKGMEALLRWIDAELGFIPPDRFIPFAEETGLIVPIGEWVLERACLDVKSWNDLFGLDLRVAVNLSPIQLALPNIIETIENTLRNTNVNPSFVEIEITEMSMVDFNESLVDKLAQIRAMGITISIDDFGTGYSSLSYLKNLPVDALKVDRSFVMEIGLSETGSNMVGAIIRLAHAMNLEVVAEGVEREEELAYLRECGCEFAQGYYFSKPLPANEFFKYVMNR